MNFEHIKDSLIRETLEEYKEKIDNKKPTKLSVSNYRVEKPWGHELWLELNEYYAYKLIHMKAGNQSSLQSHASKYETNYVILGEAEGATMTQVIGFALAGLMAIAGVLTLNRVHPQLSQKDDSE